MLLHFLAKMPLVGCPECHKSLTWYDLLDTRDGYTVSCWRCGTTLYTLVGQSPTRQALQWVGRDLLRTMRDGFIEFLQVLVRIGGGSANPPG
jgi:ribosomal protein S27E